VVASCNVVSHVSNRTQGLFDSPSCTSSHALTACLRRLTSLASFIGHVCRAYPDMELTALLQYLVNQLRDRESHDLVVLKDLISTMTVRSTAELCTPSFLQTSTGLGYATPSVSVSSIKARCNLLAHGQSSSPNTASVQTLYFRINDYVFALLK